MAEEFIKRKDVLECIKESRDGIDWGQSEDGDAFLHYSACLYRTIASNECFPSADVAEVRHGEWIKEKDGCVVCSICGYPDEINLISYEFMYNNFCANCGADMRKDGGQ